MPKISLTTFLDFALASSGTPQLTMVRQAKRRYEGGYVRQFDLWGQLRDQFVETATKNLPPESLHVVLDTLRDHRRKDKYPPVVRVAEDWLRRTKPEWLGTRRWDWVSGDLSVSVNPEVGLRFGGHDYFIKLYWKAPAPTQLRWNSMLHLMRECADSAGYSGWRVAILDVPRGKLYGEPTNVPGLAVLLHGQAAALSTMWGML